MPALSGVEGSGAEGAGGFAVWITGLPASGKSALARGVAERLRSSHGIRVQVLESDTLRKVITPEPTYSLGERESFYRILADLGELLTENGIPVIFDATANRRRYRERARGAIPRFMEVYVRCPLTVCMARDPKGIYRRGKTGGTETVPGMQDPYEEPPDPDVVVDSDRETPEEGAEKVLRRIKEKGWI
ncbi:MAG: adenylyl-sulfate kinase [Nitrospirae bacterium]|nr:adenylyl-sulfate kinase [Nitrospirota bacterium]